VSVSPISPGIPVTTLMIPGGSSGVTISMARMSDSGHVSGGFNTTALPASSAGTICRNASPTGAFQGTMETTTP
jgi:hypothetical protein